jgi:hypothetical protein
MSYDKSNNTITVDDVVYDVEMHSTDYGTRYTLSFDGEACFEGLEGLVEMEQYIEDHDNPRQDSNVGTIAIHYSGYNLGDEDISDIEFEVTCDKCDGSGELDDDWSVRISTMTEIPVKSNHHFFSEQAALDYADTLAVQNDERIIIDQGCEHCNREGVIHLNPVDYFKKERGARVVLPLIVYEHSGITIRVGHVGSVAGDAAGWDTSFVGYIFDTPEQVEQCIGDMSNRSEADQLEIVTKALHAEIEGYASYLEGDVTWFKVVDEETDYHESCGGFIGCVEEAEDEMYSNLEHALVKRIAEEAERLYWLQREVLTV